MKWLSLYWNMPQESDVFYSQRVSDAELKFCCGSKQKWLAELNTGNCRKYSNIRHPFVGNKIVDHTDVVGASPVGAAPTTSSFST